MAFSFVVTFPSDIDMTAVRRLLMEPVASPPAVIQAPLRQPIGKEEEEEEEEEEEGGEDSDEYRDFVIVDDDQ
jgi:ribosomal protein L12E/L44/L45/RPP1/RPP2